MFFINVCNVDSNVIVFSPQIFAVPFKNIYMPGVTLNGLACFSLCLPSRRTPHLSRFKPENFLRFILGVSSICSPKKKLRRNFKRQRAQTCAAQYLDNLFSGSEFPFSQNRTVRKVSGFRHLSWSFVVNIWLRNLRSRFWKQPGAGVVSRFGILQCPPWPGALRPTCRVA